ncbi:MAG: DUF2213 domain-containing protein [Desulfarculales bacterium]|jgi:hypothetical protein|nr:DUF2213 domain-containing protein [Desulfarculales bacterium]
MSEFREDDHKRDDQGKFAAQDGSGQSTTITGNELGEYKNVKELRQKAVDYYKNNLQGKPAHRDDIGEIRFSDKGLDKTIHLSANEDKLLMFPALKGIVETGKLGKEEALNHPRKDGIVAFIPVTKTVDFKGKPKEVEVLLGKDAFGKLYYNLYLDNSRQAEKRKNSLTVGMRNKVMVRREFLMGAWDNKPSPLDSNINPEEEKINIFFVGEDDKEPAMTHILKKQFSRIHNWRIDPDGMLRITAHVLKEGIYDYMPEEAPDELKSLPVIKEFIPADQYTPEAIQSLEGKPVIIDAHEWREPENTLRDGYTVGTVAGTPKISDDGACLECDMIIYDPATIEDIKLGKLIEVSAAYDTDLDIVNGDYNGETYNAEQKNFRFNHILLLPEGQGRCGGDVRIINRKPLEGDVMTGQHTFSVRIGNATRTFRFNSEDDKKEAEGMLEEERQFNAEQLQESLDARENLSKQIDELKAQLAEHDKNLEAAKAEIERLLSAETQEVMAAEYAEQGKSEEAVVDAETDNLGEEGEVKNEDEAKEEKEKVLNSIRKGANMAARRKNMVDYIMGKREVKIPSTWDQNAYDAAFETLVVQAHAQNAKRDKKNRVLNGTLTPGKGGNNPASNRERMLNPMKIKNAALEAQKGGVSHA